MSTPYSSEYVPSSSVYANILVIFTLIMCFAFTWQAINAINLYADLRNEGNIAEGRWTASYADPATTEEIAAYSFTVDDKTYRGSQPNPISPAPIVQGDPVDIVYLTSDPTQSRVAGTEGYRIQSIIEIIISAVIAILAVQYLFAYHNRRPAWIFMVQSLLRRNPST